MFCLVLVSVWQYAGYLMLIYVAGFMSVSDSLKEAARIDGSNEFRIFNEIVLPIMKPAIAVQAIFSFVGSWNNYFMPSLLLNKPEVKTVPVMIATLRSADYTKFDMGKVYMLMLMAILPVMVIYIILSKSIIKGVTSGSVKG